MMRGEQVRDCGGCAANARFNDGGMVTMNEMRSAMGREQYRPSEQTGTSFANAHCTVTVKRARGNEIPGKPVWPLPEHGSQNDT